MNQYRLYYDSDRSLFLLLDSNGCFYKSSDNSGTCLAFDHQSAEDFKQNVLSKRSSIKKTMKLDFVVKPIKQININRQKEYRLVVNQYNLEASLIIMPEVNDSGKKDLKLFYSLTLSDATEKQKTSTRPFIIDPNYLLENMQASAVEKAELL